MKKILLLLILVLTSGCTANYTLKIDENDQFIENVQISATNVIESNELYNDPWPTKAYYSDPESGEYPEKLEGVEYYNDNTVLNNDYYQKQLSYTFSKPKFKDNNIIKSCYENFYVTDDSNNNTISLSTSAKFLCMEDYPELTNVFIKIEVANPVVSSNASNVDGNVYEWEITRENYETSGIILTYQKEKNILETEEKPKSQYNKTLAFGLLGSFFVFIIGIIIYKIKKNS